MGIAIILRVGREADKRAVGIAIKKDTVVGSACFNVLDARLSQVTKVTHRLRVHYKKWLKNKMILVNCFRKIFDNVCTLFIN